MDIPRVDRWFQVGIDKEGRLKGRVVVDHSVLVLPALHLPEFGAHGRPFSLASLHSGMRTRTLGGVGYTASLLQEQGEH